jgi:predicted GIY-YIG superfamily endonuclease
MTIVSWHTYILLCDKKTFYVGITHNMSQRLTSHKLKYNLATKKFSTVDLVYSEEYSTRLQAERRERQLKGWNRTKKIALINGNVDYLILLSKS